MIRRLGILFVLAFFLAACAGAERDAVTVGDRSMSRADLIGFARLSAEIGQGIEYDTSIDAAQVRQSATVAVQQFAQLEALKEVGVVATPDQRSAAAADLSNLIAEQVQLSALPAEQGGRPPMTDFVVEYSESSPGFEFVIDLFSIESAVASNNDLVPLVRTETISELLDSAEVESRIGIWDPTIGEVLRPSGITDAEAAQRAQEALEASLAGNS